MIFKNFTQNVVMIYVSLIQTRIMRTLQTKSVYIRKICDELSLKKVFRTNL